MLVNKLRNLNYKSVSEQVAPEGKCIRLNCYQEELEKRNLGIWELFGYYDSKEQKVYLCEENISEESKKIAKNLNYNETETYAILRELVRLHEHIHAYTHQEIGEEFLRIPSTINEPLTEFLSYCVIKNYEDEDYRQKYLAVFMEVDKNHPKYYRNWRDILNVVIDKNQGLKVGYFCDNPSQHEKAVKIVFRIVIEIIKDLAPNSSFNDFLKEIEFTFLCRAITYALENT